MQVSVVLIQQVISAVPAKNSFKYDISFEGLPPSIPLHVIKW